MPTRLQWMPLLALTMLLLGGCGKDKEDETPEPEPTTLNKQVTLNIFTETDYSDSRWKDSKMKLTLRLKRVAHNPHQEVVVLDTTMGWLTFQELPKPSSKMQLIKKFNGVSREHEDIVISVSKLISINGYESTFAHSLTLERNKENELVDIKL
ncbi:MAG: hypothetical protein LPK09_15050 [Hymenobacteraceae bacterium]|nr:hypothetical protein [Hymenobacteraceae bacterium]